MTTVERHALLAAVKDCASASATAPDQHKGAVTLVTGGGHLRVEGVSTEAASRHSVAVTGRGSVAVAVDGRKLSAVLSRWPSDVVELSEVGRQLQIGEGSTTARLPGRDVLDSLSFPALVEPDATIRLDAARLRQIAARVAPAVGEAARYGLNGAYVHTVDGLIRFVASEGFMLAACHADPGATLTGSVPRDTLIPPAALVGLAKIDGEGPVDLAIGRHAIWITVDGVTHWWLAVDGEFPDYAPLCAGEATSRAVYDAAQLRAAMGRCAVLATASKAGACVQFRLTDDGVDVSSRSTDGEHAERVAAEVSGVLYETGINPTRLQIALDAVGATDRVTIDGGDPLRPHRVHIDGPDFAIVMPMRID